MASHEDTMLPEHARAHDAHRIEKLFVLLSVSLVVPEKLSHRIEKLCVLKILTGRSRACDACRIGKVLVFLFSEIAEFVLTASPLPVR